MAKTVYILPAKRHLSLALRSIAGLMNTCGSLIGNNYYCLLVQLDFIVPVAHVKGRFQSWTYGHVNALSTAAISAFASFSAINWINISLFCFFLYFFFF